MSSEIGLRRIRPLGFRPRWFRPVKLRPGRRALAPVSAVRGQFRVADPELERFELYDGLGVTPDLTGESAATGAELPIVAPLAAGQTHHLVTLRRNRYGLRTLVAPEQVVVIDGEGNEVLARPRNPIEVTASALVDGRVRVTAGYEWEAEPAGVAADEWAVWAKVGSDPIPGADEPVGVVGHVKTEILETLEFDTAAFADGAEVHVLVRVRRSADGVMSANTEAMVVEARVVGGAVLRAGGFMGEKSLQGG